jgi:acyl CoA:acetate/3-ketoacid CoA transferase alpha subunit/acyl CoA:acetate/3-ketoacid CoA transferase beta subunit
MTELAQGFLAGELATTFELPADEGSSKVMNLGAAIRAFVKPGATIHVAYSDARPNAALMELARCFAGTDPGFTLVTAGMVNLQHALVELGLVRRVVASFAGENFPVARPNPALVRALREGRVLIENWSLWSLIARLQAGALGVSHFPVRSLHGSDMGTEAAARGEYLELAVAGAEQPLGLVAALRPDIVLLHGAAADAHGNVVLAAPYGEGQWGSLAARDGAIACVERIVSTREIRALSRLARVPAHAVRAVCHVPFGAHPYGFNDPGVAGLASYVEDEPFVVAALAASRDPGTFRAWIDEWVLGVRDHEEFIAKLGEPRLKGLTRATFPEPRAEDFLAAAASGEPASPTEAQVIVAARRLRSAVAARGFQAVLAGVGLSNLAAWVGARNLREDGVDIELMAEIGLFGYNPRPGEPFIFAGCNVPTNKLLTDVQSVLGTYVAGPGTRSIGMIGAGEIDRTGAINSTYTADGRFIVGSGGANDVLSAADEVIVTVSQQPTRLVEKVHYVTCPGDRVRTIVTDLAVFDRDADGEFVLTALLPAAGEDDAAAVQRVRELTGWEFRAATKPEREPEPSARDLALLRAFDPKSQFLRDRRG